MRTFREPCEPEAALCFWLVVGRQGNDGNFALLEKHGFVYFEGKRKNVRYPDNLYSILASASWVSQKHWTAANLSESYTQTLSWHWYFCKSCWTSISWVSVSFRTDVLFSPCFLPTLASLQKHHQFEQQHLESRYWFHLFQESETVAQFSELAYHFRFIPAFLLATCCDPANWAFLCRCIVHIVSVSICTSFLPHFVPE